MTSRNGVLGNPEAVQRTYYETFKSLSLWWRTILNPTKTSVRSETPMKKTMAVRLVEEFRPGYPRFTALIGASNSFYLCRRFSILRARLLLLKQDKLSMLEKKLEQIDRDETASLFLGKSRWDKNAERQSILSEIDTCLADYDSFVERTSRMLQFKSTQSRDISSLQNWVEGNACLDREETAYLNHTSDLISLSSTNDVGWLEEWVEDKLISYYRGFREDPAHDVSTDSNVYIYSGSLTKQIAHAVLLSVMAFLLLIPVIACSAISSITSRIIIIIASNLIFLIIMSNFCKPNSTELFLAASTYMTILTAFLSGSNAVYN